MSASLRLAGAELALTCGIVPVMSVAAIAAATGAAACGITTDAVLSVLGAGAFIDCRPIGVGDVIEGMAGIVGLALSTGGGAAGGCSREISDSGIDGAVPLSNSVIAILKVPSTITTTLAPTSSERIFEVMVDD